MMTPVSLVLRAGKRGADAETIDPRVMVGPAP